MQPQGWRRRARALARVGSRPLIAALLIAPAVLLAATPPATPTVTAQSNGDGDVIAEDFEAPRYNQFIAIIDNSEADRYNSRVAVSGMDGRIVDVNLILRNVAHDRPEDISVLLEHAGRSVVMMRRAGGEFALAGANIVFDNDADESIPDSGPIVGNRAYDPRDYDAANTPFGGGAPTANDSGNLGLDFFNGVTANGDWTLWVRDDRAPISGSLDGWQLEIVTDNTAPFTDQFNFRVKQNRTLRVPASRGLLRHVAGRSEGNFDVDLQDGPNKGRLRLRSDGSFTYEPKGKKKGRDSFTYTVVDAFGAETQGDGKVVIKIKKDKKDKKDRKRRR